MRHRPGPVDLVLATARSPIGDDDGDAVLGRAHTALMHTVSSRGGAWVAATDIPPKAAASSWLVPLEISAPVLSGWRDGQCANTLASTYYGHSGITPPQDPAWKAAYEQVNARYAAAIARSADDGAAIWLHDYPLQLVPAILRRMRPDLRIGFTLHSPLPPAESFQTLAGRDDLLAGLAAADLLSFTDERSRANFAAIADQTGTAYGRTLVMPMPADAHVISQLAETWTVQTHAAQIRTSLRPASTVLLSIGGNDPGDGTLQRLQEFARLLDTRQLQAQECAFIQLAPNGDGLTPEAAQLRAELERLTAKINGQHGCLSHLPVHYQRGVLSPAELTAFYLAADVMLATPMRDRATPHAAEYAATRTHGRGCIVLSEFSATPLPGAVVINPHDPEALGRAMLAAAAQCHTASRQVVAMRSQTLTSGGITTWADQFLHNLKPVKHRTATGRLHQTWRSVPTGRHQEGSRQRVQASDTSGQLTVTAPHP
ncbi:trehalose-6-phosphate synthase [Rhizocola hellebori]|uniref:Trehalose-6-phosphate synthase n=1 Tax=Rhizocola hellebori TaxID=1392758 RepID=A0A8J3Q8D4_9ACTN|nr:trehalose-6-phosphate synthase [Rhizocola hellebori]GIH05237.1 trehalose-6-phosphate synthase [Rhizocola hellebori]